MQEIEVILKLKCLKTKPKMSLKKILQETLEQIKVNLEEVKIEREKKGTNHAKVKKDYDKLKGEVEALKKSFNGSDDEYQEYLKELAVFDKFRFLRAKNGTQLTL